MKTTFITKILIPTLSLFVLSTPRQASAQIIPQPWVSVGGSEGEITYAIGARALNFGVEVGKGPDDAVGFDVLKFVSVPVVSPYVGLGWYSEDKGISVSGGVQVNTSQNVFVGAGYNSVRGFNGQLGVKF